MTTAQIYYTTHTQNEMIKTYVEMQMDILTQFSESPAIYEVHLRKENGAYCVSIRFISADFVEESFAKSWSPYKAIELATVTLREQLMQRAYNLYRYA